MWHLVCDAPASLAACTDTCADSRVLAMRRWRHKTVASTLEDLRKAWGEDGEDQAPGSARSHSGGLARSASASPTNAPPRTPRRGRSRRSTVIDVQRVLESGTLRSAECTQATTAHGRRTLQKQLGISTSRQVRLVDGNGNKLTVEKLDQEQLDWIMHEFERMTLYVQPYCLGTSRSLPSGRSRDHSGCAPRGPLCRYYNVDGVRSLVAVAACLVLQCCASHESLPRVVIVVAVVSHAILAAVVPCQPTVSARHRGRSAAQ